VKRPLGFLPNKRATFVIDRDGTVLATISSETNMDKHADEALATLAKRGTTSPTD
jgi:thioredoxin-dependent peroxiredoxin